MTNTSELIYWLTVLHIYNIGPRKISQWLTHFPNVESLITADAETLSDIGLNAYEIYSLHHPNHTEIEKDLTWLNSPQHHIITLTDPTYPQLLREIAAPPFVLYILGNPTLLSSPQIAIVGSRHPTHAGLHNAFQFADYLAQAGLTITSGLAIGIDGASHKGALAHHGKTIAVSGTGLNHIYPYSHRKLAEEIIAQDGAIISEFPLNTPAHAHNFPRRNRIISGLSQGVLVIEAALKSGSLSTAHHALEQNREVFAIPGSIHHPLSRGCHHLIRQGAKLVEKAEDVFEEFNLTSLSQKKLISETKSIDPIHHLSPGVTKVLAAFVENVTPLDAIILCSGLTASEVSSILLRLELEEKIESVVGGYVRIERGD